MLVCLLVKFMIGGEVKSKTFDSDTRQAVMDGVLRFVAGGGFLTTVLLAPNAAQMFDKPLTKLLARLDERSRDRELRRAVHYMKQRGLITYETRDYQNGIRLTPKGKKKLEERNIDALAIARPDAWDEKWRLVFFDIPEDLKTRRNALSRRLRWLGFQQLQKSIWIHPFPCRSELEALTEYIGIRKFVTYVEISQIDGDPQLRRRFRQLLTS
jgi:DNA-binding transcriptional regulator PaaX